MLHDIYDEINRLELHEEFHLDSKTRNIYDEINRLELHEEFHLDSKTRIMKVIGGWLYKFGSYGNPEVVVFVPLNNEINQNKLFEVYEETK